MFSGVVVGEGGLQIFLSIEWEQAGCMASGFDLKIFKILMSCFFEKISESLVFNWCRIADFLEALK